MSSDIYSDQAISTSTHTLSLCKYVAHCMLNTRWPGDGPPLKRLFGTKLKTVYLKKQVYNSARWIAGSGWREEAMETRARWPCSEPAGRLGAALRLPAPPSASRARPQQEGAVDATHERCSLRCSRCSRCSRRWGGGVGGAQPQFSRGSIGAGRDQGARVQPRSAPPLILGASLVHSFIRQTRTKHLQGTSTWGYRQGRVGPNSGLAT